MRDPHAFTPMLEEGVNGNPPRSLMLGSDLAMNLREIGKFSQKDAKVIQTLWKPQYIMFLKLCTHAFYIPAEHMFSYLTQKYELKKFCTLCLCKCMLFHSPSFTLLFIHCLICTQAFPDFVVHLEKLAGAIHPLLDAPPVDIPGITAGSLRKRLSAAKTLMPIIRCGQLANHPMSK